jgi:hypothetical protein
MVIRYIKEEYVGKSCDADKILSAVSPYISEVDCDHIRGIINQGCPSYLDFEEDYYNKHLVLRKGNQQTFFEHPKVTAKAMSKEEKNSHVLPFRYWIVHFSPYCCATPQGIREKYGKYRVIFDSSTQTSPDKMVLNQVTLTDHEATIDFGTAKTKLLINIYKRGNSGNVIQSCAVGVHRIVARGAGYIKSIHIDSYSSINILAHQKPT